jgi:cytidine deaminase
MKVGGLNLGNHPEFDPYHLFIGMIPNMVDQARYAAKNDSESYRGFLVGAAAFAVNFGAQETFVFASGNTKRNEHKTKICAEKKVLNAAKKVGATRVIGLIVAGTTDIEKIEEVTNARTSTLHPCGECRTLFEGHSMVRNDLIVVTAGLEDDTYQVQTAAELRDAYAARSATHLESQETFEGFENWNERQSLYDYLAIAEQTVPEAQRRSSAQLARMAIAA